MAEVEWIQSALDDLEKIDPAIAKRIVRKISWIAENFDNIVPEPLHGKFKGTYKQRIGDFRIIYTIEENTIIIQFVGHRREVYQ